MQVVRAPVMSRGGTGTLDAAPTADAIEDAPDIRGRNILIFGINYAPEPTGIAPYTTDMAEHLAAQGAQVTVVTGLPHYPSWSTDEMYRTGWVWRSRVNGVEIVRLRHTVPAQMTVARRSMYEASFLAHSVARSLLRRPDVVLAVSPALGGAVAAALVARRTGAPLVTIVQDLMAKAAGESGITAGGRAGRVAARVESFALRGADRVLVVTDGFRAGVEAYGVDPAKIGTLRNWTRVCPATMTRSEARERLGWEQGAFLAVHTGNMGFKQHLENVIDASRLLAEEDNTRYVLVGDGSQRAHLEQYATGAPFVRFVDPVDAATYPLVLAAADVLLVNERATVAEMSLPSKLTSYLVSGRPIVAAVAHGGVTARELECAGAAMVVPSGVPGRLADAVQRLRAGGDLRSELARAGNDYAQTTISRARSLGVLQGCLAAQVTTGARG